MRAKGMIRLPITLGTKPKTTTSVEKFIVVDTGAKHNAILERPTLWEMRVVILLFHLTMKFPTSDGIGHINGQQGDAREWYERSLEESKKKSCYLVGERIKQRKLVETTRWASPRNR